MLIVDGQIHLWEKGAPSPQHRQEPYSAEQAIAAMDQAVSFQPELLALAKYPNVAVKATGKPGYAEDAYPYRSFHEHLQRCFDAFGADRIFWGVCPAGCGYRQGTGIMHRDSRFIARRSRCLTPPA
jgi:predicted TIM-barrel fold metal-dependent hydrolase